MSSPPDSEMSFASTAGPYEDVLANKSIGGLSNPQLNHGRRRMLDLVNKLHSTGCVTRFTLSFHLFDRELAIRVQVDIDLPQIAVIGSQSAGKSSLIESISGITLPRAAGTCTRYVRAAMTFKYTSLI